MSTLKSISELAWRQIFPKGNAETKITKQEFLASAKSEYAYQFWIKWKQQKVIEGEAEIPSFLLSETEVDVRDDVMDISGLRIMTGLDFDQWLQNVGGVHCSCHYIKSSLNHSQLLCDDDSLPDDAKTYYAISGKIIFPKGVHKSPLKIIYANNGENIDGNLQVDDVMASLIRRGLQSLYAPGTIGRQDKTNNNTTVE